MPQEGPPIHTPVPNIALRRGSKTTQIQIVTKTLGHGATMLGRTHYIINQYIATESSTGFALGHMQGVELVDKPCTKTLARDSRNRVSRHKRLWYKHNCEFPISSLRCLSFQTSYSARQAGRSLKPACLTMAIFVGLNPRAILGVLRNFAANTVYPALPSITWCCCNRW